MYLSIVKYNMIRYCCNLITILLIYITFSCNVNYIKCEDWSSIFEDEIIIENEMKIDGDECSIHTTDSITDPQPLLIIPNTDQFLLPQTRDGFIWMQPGEQVELYCTNGFHSPYPGYNTLIATCGSNNKLTVMDDGIEYDFTAFNCTSYPYHTARRTDETCANGDGIIIEIGFEVGNRFFHVMYICHNEIVESNYYAYHQLTPANYGYQHGFPRPSFITGGFFGGKNVDQIYTKVSQMATIGRILGEELLDELFDDSQDIYLARGHLAAKVDYIFGAHQRATFYFLNVAPQWQIFNGGNWERVESGVRTFVADRNIEVDVYTGTFGVLQLRDINNNFQDIFLYFDENNNGQIPVPMLYYKLVIEPATGRGIVLLGVNNPHITEQDLSDYIICRNIGHLITWINWDRESFRKGYSYACEVNEFVQRVGHLPPEIHATGILF